MSTLRRLVAVAAAVVSLGAFSGCYRPHPSSMPTSVTRTMYVTFYGWPDNDPPGDIISYPGLHQVAGGTGTYADPITIATDAQEITPGTRVYVPSLQKYFIMEDECAECVSDWNNKREYHIDLWVGGGGVKVSTVLAQENKLTRTAPVVVNPPGNEPVNKVPLLNV